jgi:hypothetical protein
MTHEQMAAVIKGGGTILHEGRMIGKVEELPSTAELAGQDIPKLLAEQAKLEKDAADLKIQQDKVKASLAEAHAAAKAPKPDPVKEPAKKAA